ncbi:hypothetical protein CBR_g23552 [Chara braunii]|uniref:Reverse transcriptase domain-containing protein n=1 Tax=Chara braunii TaxID=69332 RepID=A0A388L4I7_CHABU|nr:hypothetical protein CBR_g23552 [Chara braunii]|eukprot:GBG77225.1 hypothetical protein CBR_g23552 [Chara braunii]
MCIDYRGLKKITRKSTEPIPRIDDLVDMVQGCTVFNKIDLKSGYHQIEMAEEDVHKTAFKTRYGTYEYPVMPFGLCNASGTFQIEMHHIFRPYLDKFMVVYLDDILVFSRTTWEHAEHPTLVLQSLPDSQYKINREKSFFGVPSAIYLGRVISGDGLAPEAAKIVAVQEWPQPQIVRDVRSFMGLASYYIKFVRNFSAVVAPLTNLTKKDTPFLWSLPCQLAFTRLKKDLTRAPVLKLPDPTLPFILTTDASQYGIGAVLQQDDGNGLRPVEFMSKKIKTQKLHDSTYEKELYALVCGCKVFSKIDLKFGYHQIEVDPIDQHKSAFKTRDGLFPSLNADVTPPSEADVAEPVSSAADVAEPASSAADVADSLPSNLEVVEVESDGSRLDPSRSSTAVAAAAAEETSEHTSEVTSLAAEGAMSSSSAAEEATSSAATIEQAHTAMASSSTTQTIDSTSSSSPASAAAAPGLACRAGIGYSSGGDGVSTAGNYIEAVADFTRAIELDPKNADFYHNRGFSYRKLGKFEEAISDYTMAIKLNPQHCRAYYNRAFSYDRMKNYEAAIADYTEVSMHE